MSGLEEHEEHDRRVWAALQRGDVGEVIGLGGRASREHIEIAVLIMQGVVSAVLDGDARCDELESILERLDGRSGRGASYRRAHELVERAACDVARTDDEAVHAAMVRVLRHDLAALDRRFAALRDADIAADLRRPRALAWTKLARLVLRCGAWGHRGLLEREDTRHVARALRNAAKG